MVDVAAGYDFVSGIEITQELIDAGSAKITCAHAHARLPACAHAHAGLPAVPRAVPALRVAFAPCSPRIASYARMKAPKTACAPRA